MMTHAAHGEPNVRRAELRFGSHAEQIVSMPALRRHRWTVDEVRRLVDERVGMTPRYELVDGELLVTPAPRKRDQRIIFRLALLLQAYVAREKLGEVCLGPDELPLVSGERYEPDLFVVPAIDGRLRPAADTDFRPLLVCEVLSQGSSRHDRLTKRRAFQRNAVPEYWIIDGDAEAIEVWHPDDERAALIDERVVWQPHGATAAFELDVRALFAAVADDAPLG
jgi:Uma2 family endonuclease